MDVVGIFLSPLLRAVFDKLLSPELIKLARREGVTASIQKLKKTLEEINDVFADAEDRQISDRVVDKWLKELHHLAYDADDVLDEFATEALRRKLNMAETEADDEGNTSSKVRRCLLPFSTCCSVITKPSTIVFNLAIGPKINEITNQFQDLATRIKELGLVRKAVGNKSMEKMQKPLPTTCLVNEPCVYGRDEEKKKIIEFLLRSDALTENKVDVIPIVGMGGIGKTTLAQLIYDDKVVQNHFDLKAWVCVSDEFDVRRITKAILESFTRQPCNLEQLNEVQCQLKSTLERKKFFLVLDDVWSHNYDHWNLLQSPFSAGALGSKIIVTTRITEVATQMGAIKYPNLEKLSDDDCWLILAQHAFKNINISERQELEAIGKKIVDKRCGGLPLAARTIGGLLRCKQKEHEWKEVLNNNIWDDKSGIIPALKLSYHHLPSHLKRCFDYCAIIPKDYEFQENELVLLWMAEGLIKVPEGREKIEDLGSDYFQELVSRSFFQSSSGNKSLFIMHDLINDLAQAVAGDICFRLDDNLESGKQNKISEKARHSSYVASCYDGIKKFKAFDDAKCLRTFLQFSLQSDLHVTSYLVQDLLPKLKWLRELRLCSYGIKELPDSIGDLKHLRYLDVSKSGITRLPDSVATLYNLQVLLLKFCHFLKKLPRDMGNLVNMRHFDMTGTSIPSSQEMPLQIGKLTNLQTLSNFMVGKGSQNRIGELKNLSHIQGTIHISRLENVSGVKEAMDANLISKEALKELSLEWDDSHSPKNDMVDKDVLDMIRPYKLLERLTICGYGHTKFPNWVGDASFSKMVSMRLARCKCCTSLPPLGQLPLLKDLYIEGMNAVNNLGDEFHGHGCAKPFPILERLSFVDMPEWESWSTFVIEGVQPYSQLSELSIRNCPKLVGRLSNDLPCLTSLKIDGCPQLLIDAASLVLPSLTSLFMSNVMLRSLSTLREMKRKLELGSLTLDIRHATVLDSLCDPSDEVLLANAISEHLTSVTNLRMCKVEKLAFLPKWFAQGLMRLEKLNISSCEELVTLWQNEVRLQQYLPSLRHLVISECPKLVCLFEEEEEKEEGDGWKKQQHEGPRCMTRLEYLEINKCGMLKKLPQDLHTYTSVGVLKIGNCGSLVSFPKKGLPSMLRELEVWGCHALQSLPELMTLNNLQLLKVFYCGSLTYLSSRGGLPSTLKQLDIRECKKLESLFAEKWIKIHCPSLENIYIRNCWSLATIYIDSCWRLKSLSNASNLRSLGELSLFGCSKLKYLSLGAPDKNNQLTSLQKLEISYCPAGIVSYFLKEGSFPTNLSSLNISGNVGQLPPPSEWGLHRLSSLKVLSLGGSNEDHLDGSSSPWEDTVSFPPEEGMLLPTSLINLCIDYFPNLERLSYEEFRNLTSLETLRIRRCPRLASFPKEGLPPSLLHLEIWNCPELVSFPEQGFPLSLLSLKISGRCHPILKQRCEKGKGQYWPIIQYIPEVDMQYMQPTARGTL